MTTNKDSFNKTALLTLSRVFGVVFSFVIPMYLGRTLEVTDYGTYKQIMLFYWFAQVGLNFGLDDSVYYLIRWKPEGFALYSFNAFVFNFGLSGIMALLFIYFRGPISLGLNNPELAQYIPLLSLLLVLTICSMQVEGALMNLDRLKDRLALEISMELFKALAILAAFVFFNSIMMVLLFLTILMAIRFILAVRLNLQSKIQHGLRYKDAAVYWRQQLAYGIPLGIARILQNIFNLERLLISSFFSMRQFTFYSVGCFENPLINAAQASFYEMANIEMVDAVKKNRYDLALEIWRNTMRKLMLVIIPFVAYMTLFAQEIIVFIFSEKYIDSVPFFIAFNFTVLVAAFNPEPLFRATSKNQLVLKLKIIGLSIGAIVLVWVALNSTSLAVLITKGVIFFLLNLLGLKMGAKLIKANLLQLFRWRELAGVSLLSILLASILKLSISGVDWHPFWILALTFTIYVSMHFVLSTYFRLIRKDEVEHLKNLIKRVMPTR